MEFSWFVGLLDLEGSLLFSTPEGVETFYFNGFSMVTFYFGVFQNRLSRKLPIEFIFIKVEA